MTDDELRLIETRSRQYASKLHLALGAKRQRILDEQALIAEVRRLMTLTAPPAPPRSIHEVVTENARKVDEKAAAIIAQFWRKP